MVRSRPVLATQPTRGDATKMTVMAPHWKRGEVGREGPKEGAEVRQWPRVKAERRPGQQGAAEGAAALMLLAKLPRCLSKKMPKPSPH